MFEQLHVVSILVSGSVVFIQRWGGGGYFLKSEKHAHESVILFLKLERWTRGLVPRHWLRSNRVRADGYPLGLHHPRQLISIFSL